MLSILKINTINFWNIYLSCKGPESYIKICEKRLVAPANLTWIETRHRADVAVLKITSSQRENKAKIVLSFEWELRLISFYNLTDIL